MPGVTSLVHKQLLAKMEQNLFSQMKAASEKVNEM